MDDGVSVAGGKWSITKAEMKDRERLVLVYHNSREISTTYHEMLPGYFNLPRRQHEHIVRIKNLQTFASNLLARRQQLDTRHPSHNFLVPIKRPDE